jgi:hypothetical protein
MIKKSTGIRCITIRLADPTLLVDRRQFDGLAQSKTENLGLVHQLSHQVCMASVTRDVANKVA